MHSLKNQIFSAEKVLIGLSQQYFELTVDFFYTNLNRHPWRLVENLPLI